jgi:hypothetical protein
MPLTGRKANWLLAVIVLTDLVSCAGPSQPYVESDRLTKTDIEVLRVGLASSIEPRLGEPSKRIKVLTASTLLIPLWKAPPVAFPPAPPPPFRGSRDPVVPPPAPAALDASLFSTEERAAWERRNRVAREIPDLVIAGLVTRHSAEDVPADWTVIAASAPSYPTKETALLYAQFRCGGTCGEGWLIRLSRDGQSWRVTASQRLWVS